MADGILGKKIGMTQIFSETGQVLPVTVISTKSCVVSQIKTVDQDGYIACQLALGEKKYKRASKAQTKHFEKAGLKPGHFIKEIVPANPDKYKLGETVALSDILSEGDKIKITGQSIGKGFAGVMKRHGFAGGPASHGSHFHRTPGAIGQCAWPAKTFRGKKLPGQMGNKQVTVRNLDVVRIDSEEGLLLIKGAVPGSKGGYVIIEQVKS